MGTFWVRVNLLPLWRAARHGDLTFKLGMTKMRLKIAMDCVVPHIEFGPAWCKLRNFVDARTANPGMNAQCTVHSSSPKSRQPTFSR